jgi:hypothetical protein
MSKSKETTWGDLSGATFLSKDDVAEPIVATIDGFKREEVGTGNEAEIKTVVYWQENVKPLVAGKMVINQIKAVTGAELPREAKGKRVELYLDKTVAFKGQITGGVRVREPSA